MKVAIVGRRNTGKSTLVNTLAQAERVIVSEVPGTTRDTIDVRYEIDGKTFVAIDTPGFRRSKSIDTDIDFYSTHRAQRAIRRADVVLLFFDASQRISKVDKQLCDYIAAAIQAVHLRGQQVGPHGRHDADGEVGRLSPRHVSAPCTTCRSLSSPARPARTSRRCSTTPRCFSSSRGCGFRPARPNKLLRAAHRKEPAAHCIRTAARRFSYATQVAEQPPTIVLFCNDPRAVSQSYQRYLLGVLREQLKFDEVPIKLYLRSREQSDSARDIDPKTAK